MDNIRDCIKCNKKHHVIKGEFLPEICTCCYIELSQSIPEYIPQLQQLIWIERKVKKYYGNNL